MKIEIDHPTPICEFVKFDGVEYFVTNCSITETDEIITPVIFKNQECNRVPTGIID
jgi:hypothetical protein